MSATRYRMAGLGDIRAMALIRASYSETEEYWTARISEYLEGAHHPQQALETRVPYVALQDDSVVGFIAGHRAIRLRR